MLFIKDVEYQKLIIHFFQQPWREETLQTSNHERTIFFSFKYECCFVLNLNYFFQQLISYPTCEPNPIFLTVMSSKDIFSSESGKLKIIIEKIIKTDNDTDITITESNKVKEQKHKLQKRIICTCAANQISVMAIHSTSQLGKICVSTKTNRKLRFFLEYTPTGPGLSI